MSERRRKRHSPDQIISKLREADGWLTSGESMAAVCQKLQVSQATYHRWRQLYGGMKAQGVKQLKELQEQNARLKRAVADRTLDKQILKEVIDGIEQGKI
jgi:transposase-like protein